MTRAEETEAEHNRLSAEGRPRGERIAVLRGWQLSGWGYPSESASFRDGATYHRIEGAVIDALLAAIDSGRIVVVRR